MSVNDDIEKFVKVFNLPIECVKDFSSKLNELKLTLIDCSEIVICKNVDISTCQQHNYYVVYFKDLLKNKFMNYYNSKEFIDLYSSILRLDDISNLKDDILIAAFNSFYYLDTDHYIFENDYFYERIHKELNKKKGEFCEV